MENKTTSGIYISSSIYETSVDILFGGKIGVAKFSGEYPNENEKVFGIKMVEFDEVHKIGGLEVEPSYDDRRCVRLFFHNDEEIENFIRILKDLQDDERRRKEDA